MLNGLIEIGGLIECPQCRLTIRQTRIVAECGHRFCLDCITQGLQKNACPVCKKPADIRNLRRDPVYDNLVIYVKKLKQACLPHSLTPLEQSLQNKADTLDSVDRPYNLGDIIDASDDTTADYSLASKDVSDTPLSTTTRDKRHIDNFNEDDGFESEFDDTVHINKKAKVADTADRQKLFDPRTILQDIIPTNISPLSPITPSPAQRTSSTLNNQETPAETPKPAPIPSAPSQIEQPAAQAADVPSLEAASQPTTLNNSISPETLEREDFTMIPAPSDDDEDGETRHTWECTKCHYLNKAYVQTCLICRHYRKGDISFIQDCTTAPTTEADVVKENKGYELTAAGEDNVIANDILTTPYLRRKSEDGIKLEEAHIMYTGLTPEDEKKLHKFIEDAAVYDLKITIHYQMRDFNDVTHIITSVNRQKLCKRTLKYLQGILEGKWVVEPDWLVKSMKAKQWQPESQYEVHGDQQSGKTDAPRKGRERKDHPLLTDMKFFFHGDFLGKHKKNDLVNLINAGGGKIMKKRPAELGRKVTSRKDSLDPGQPIVIMASDSKKKPNWIDGCQFRDPSWLIDCLSRLEIS